MNASKNAPVSLVAYVTLMDLWDQGYQTVIFISPVSTFEARDFAPDSNFWFSEHLQDQLRERPEYSNQTRLRFKKKDYKLADLRACFEKILVESQAKYGGGASDLQMMLKETEPFFSTNKGARILNEVFNRKADKTKTALVIGFITNQFLMYSCQYMKNGVVPTVY